jgi:hypothetical protein
MSEALPLTLYRTKAALEKYDVVNADRPISTQAELDAWMAEEAAAIQDVRAAFYEDTKDRNSRDTIMSALQIDGWLRRMVAKYAPEAR